MTRSSVAGRHDVEQFMQDEFLESLTSSYDYDALIGADRGTYVLHQTVAYEYAAPVRNLRQRLMVMPQARHGDQQRVVHRFDVKASREQAGPDACRSFRQPGRPRERAGRRREDRVPYTGRPGPRPDRRSSCAVGRCRADPDAAHDTGCGDRRGRPLARTGPRRARDSRCDLRSHQIVVRVCPWGDFRAYHRSGRMAAAPGRLPRHGPRDDRDVRQPWHLRALRLGPPPGRGREPCLDGGVRPCP